jgi:hypothetical protein
MGEKEILAIGKVHPRQGGFRLKEIEWEEEGRICFDLDPMPVRTSEEGWGYLDGEVLE